MIDREAVYNKYDGRCAYTGKLLGDDWQVDHIVPKCLGGTDDINNLAPVLAIVNHYKRSLSIKDFKEWYLGGLHERLRKLPKNPRSEQGIRRETYLLKVAEVFDITPFKPFCGKLWFEKEDV